MVSIRDLADKLNLSSATVSMALNNRPGVNEETRRRVCALAKELGYAGGLIQKKERGRGKICFVVYQRHGKVVADTHFFTELIQSVEQNAKLFKYQIVLIFCTYGENVAQCVVDLKKNKPDGMILLGTEMEKTDLENFSALDIPTLLLDCDMQNVRMDKVVIDNIEAMKRAVQYLYEKGFREIGHLKSAVPIQNFTERQKGYLEKMEELGLFPVEFDLTSTLEKAAQDMEALLGQGLQLPQALIADNDIIACGAMKAMKRAGISIPEELSIVGFDNVSLCTLMDPELSSVSVNRKALGALAIKQLHWRIHKPKAPFVKLLVDTGFSERDSVGICRCVSENKRKC